MTTGSPKDFDDILSASERWMGAWQDQDSKTLEALLAPDFALVIASAPHYRFDRESWIDLATGPYRCRRFAYAHVQFHAVSSSIVAMSAMADQEAVLGSEDRSGRLFITDLWRRSRSGWQVCARYSSLPFQSDQPVTYLVGVELE